MRADKSQYLILENIAEKAKITGLAVSMPGKETKIGSEAGERTLYQSRFFKPNNASGGMKNDGGK